MQVMEALGMTKGGPALGKLTTQVWDWQLANPTGNKDECRAWLQKQKQNQAGGG